MRSILTKVVALSMVAGAGLLVTACGGGNSSATADNNTATEVVNSESGAEDTMVTGVDGATGNGTVVETNTAAETGNAM